MRIGVLARGVVGGELVAALRARGIAVGALVAGPEPLPAALEEGAMRPDPGDALFGAVIAARRLDGLVRIGGGGAAEEALWQALRAAVPDRPALEIALADPPAPCCRAFLEPLLQGDPRTRLRLRDTDGNEIELEVSPRGDERGAELVRRALSAAAELLEARFAGRATEGVARRSGEIGDAGRELCVEVDWHDEPQRVARLVRLLAPPFGGARARLGATRASLLAASAIDWPGAADALPGTLWIGDDTLCVRCGSAALRVTRARVAGAVIEAGELAGLLRATAAGADADSASDAAETGDYLPFGVPALGPDEEQAVLRTLRCRWIGTGPGVAAFEREFAEAVGARHAVAVSSCTAALHLALLGAEIGPGDEVITTTLSFVATANAILHTGATPVLVDVEPDTLNLDPTAVEAAVGPRTRAILPVHFGGRPCDLAPLRAVAERHGLALIEDAAHAVGALHADGTPVGGRSAEACFSFYPNKNLTTGEGGMLTTASAQRATRYRRLRMHGLANDAWRRFHARGLVRSPMTELGFKYNLTDLQAALGSVQLRRLESFTATRNEQAERYREALAPLARFRAMPPLAQGRHAYHLFTVYVDGIARDTAILELRRHGIGAAIHYVPIHLQPYYRRRFRHARGAFPVAEQAGAGTLTLPIGPSLGEAELRRVIGALRAVDVLPLRSAGNGRSRRVSKRPCDRPSTTWAAGSPDEPR